MPTATLLVPARGRGGVLIADGVVRAGRTASRIESFPKHYPWIGPEGLDYFRMRLTEARRDVQHGLQVTLDYFKTRAQQQRALDILEFKLDVLWTMLDAMYMAYISQRNPATAQEICPDRSLRHTVRGRRQKWQNQQP